ncbi:hypothetical protein MN202_20440, partial [Rheinheimera muenzenbergensis]
LNLLTTRRLTITIVKRKQDNYSDTAGPLNHGHKTAGLCSFVANFSLLFCAVYGKRYVYAGIQ